MWVKNGTNPKKYRKYVWKYGNLGFYGQNSPKIGKIFNLILVITFVFCNDFDFWLKYSCFFPEIYRMLVSDRKIVTPGGQEKIYRQNILTLYGKFLASKGKNICQFWCQFLVKVWQNPKKFRQNVWIYENFDFYR